MARDYYEILGVEKNVDADTLKKAFRKLAMKYHPDKNPGDAAAEEQFKEAAEAYDVLGTPEKKARYDRFGHAGVSGAGGGQGGFQNMDDIFDSFSDIFGDFFGGGQKRKRDRNAPQRGSDLRYVMELDLKQVVEGMEKDVEFDTEETCITCTGKGTEKGYDPEPCRTCNGSGQAIRSQGFFSVATTCPACQGRGILIRKPCKTCRGGGREEVHRRIRVTIPAGVDNGTRLRVSNEGEGGYRGGPNGDLFVEIRVADSDRFIREGNDLIGQIDISYLQALLGGEKEVSTVIDKTKIAIPQGTQVGDVLRLAEEGIPSLRSGQRGDIMYRVRVLFPHELSKDEETLLRQIAELKGDKVQVEDSGIGSFFRRKR